ncbi:MAG: porin [Steroidobacteraceae bacterium]
MNDAIEFNEGTRSGTWRKGRAEYVKLGLMLGSLLAMTGLAQAQTVPADDSLTFKGITLYGIVDLGLQYQTHGAPINDFFPAGSADIVQKNSNHSILGITPNNLSQSRIGINGKEELFDDWSAVFKLETFFNPQSGEISDACKSLAQNNGRSAASGLQTTNLDSSVCGQTFQQSFAGFSSKSIGTIVFGRQNTLIADGVAKYDPNAASQAFSLIGLSGTTAGGGDTQNRRMDQSVKYTNTFADLIHVGVMYKFNGAWGSASTAWEHNLGFNYGGFSLDGYYAKIHNAVALASLSAAQVADLPALGYSPSNALAATISDNTAFDFMAMYTWDVFKFFGGYEHISYGNPQSLSLAGFDIDAYKVAFVNNAAYPINKVLQVYWTGVKYALSPQVDLTGAWYYYHQNNYAVVAADLGCNTNKAATCAGNTEDYSADVVWKMTKRFSSYAGMMYTGVHGGQANGYVFHTNDVTTTIGLRYVF